MAVNRVRVNGRKVWQARVAYRGLRKSTIRATKEDARGAEADLLRELKEKAATIGQEAQYPATWRKLFEFYAANLAARGKSDDTIGRVNETARAVELLMPDTIDGPVSRTTEADIFEFRQLRSEGSIQARRLQHRAQALRLEGKADEAAAFERKALALQRQGTKPGTVNRDLRTLRAMLKRVRPEFKFPAGAFYPEDETRVRWLRPEEELLVFEFMRSPIREMARLAALTLMRLTEVRRLRREYVRLEQGVILLPRAKAGARPVILSGEAQKLLRHQLASHESEWVFPNPDGSPYDRSYVGRQWRKAARQAGLRDFRFHDLRHHGATVAMNKGFKDSVIMDLGGWKTPRMMRRYAAVTDETLRRAAEAVAGNEPVGSVATGHGNTLVR